VSDQSVQTTDLTAYRERADRFEAEMLEEYYLHFAGLKDELGIEALYEQYQDLTTLDAARSLEAAAHETHGIRELWRFACSGYLGNLTKSQEARLAELEATLEAAVDGETITYRMIRPTLANEPDRDRRRRLEDARCALEDEHLNAVYLEAAAIQRGAVRDLGAENSVELHERFGFRLEELADQCRRLLADTERLHEDAVDRLFRERVGMPLDEAERWDAIRMFRAPQWDELFPSDRMLPALEATLEGLGIDLDAQPNVELDVEKRPKKSPRAFCAPIEVPGRVVLVIQPVGGADDWQALFHEAGHLEHFAHTSAELPVESRRMGDNAVTEGWAALLEHLTGYPPWLSRRLDFPRPTEWAADAATMLLWAARRYSAKLLYELELFRADDPSSMKPRYVELLGDALKIDPSPTDWLADVDGGFYVSQYLRSWAFEAQMSLHLRERFGNDWFTRREAGSLLRELWSLGQAQTADEILRDLTGAEIDMAAVSEHVREVLG
jgi:hypothetical protein